MKKKAIKRIKKYMIINNIIIRDDINNLFVYPGWDKTLKHKLDELEIGINNFKIEVVKFMFGINAWELE